jgi:hypothetical protein
MDQAIVLPDRVCETLGRELARRLPDLFAGSPKLQADFDEWYKGRHGETYTKYLRRTGQESPYQARRKRGYGNA